MLDEKIFMNVEDVSKLLCVKKDTVYSWIHYRQIPDEIYRKLGRKPLFITENVIDWIKNGAVLRKRKV